MLAQADVDRELSRLGAGQEVREVESGEKRLLVYLLATIEQLVAHHRDLARRTAEVDEPEFQPVA
jgi:hypothetical protein